MAKNTEDVKLPVGEGALGIESHTVTVAKTPEEVAVVVDGNVVAKLETTPDDTTELIQQSIRLLEAIGLDFIAELLEETFEL